MSDPTRGRINAAFDDELAAAPVPPGLRALSIRAAAVAPPERSNRPQVLALVAALLAIAIVATLVIGSHVLRQTPIPSRPGSLTPPSPRTGASLVYDPSKRELVLFGGAAQPNTAKGGQPVVNETWTWDGTYWALQRSTVSPTPRHDAAMAYDAGHRVVVLYGGIAATSSAGSGGQAAVSDTWTWNGSAWNQQHPRHEPVLSFDWPATMAFDPVSKTVLLYGFAKITSGNVTNMTSQTWSWNGTDWTQLSPSAMPQGMGQLVGGAANLYLITSAGDRVGGIYVTEMWRWDGTGWTILGPSNDLVAVLGGAAFDPQHGRIVLVNVDTWTWDGSKWTRQHPQSSPSAVGYLAYFAPLHEVVSWGDRYANSSNDMWAWDGATWSQVQAGTMTPLPTPSGAINPTTPAAAQTFIRQTVKNSSPVLLPAWLPNGMEASGVATTDDFNIEYQSDQRDKAISLGMVAANPPPGGPGSSDTVVKFRHALALKYGSPGYARYFVYDPSAPQSARWLMWLEPGTMSSQGTTSQGVWYFLSASGLTDQEFWQVANSLR